VPQGGYVLSESASPSSHSIRSASIISNLARSEIEHEALSQPSPCFVPSLGSGLAGPMVLSRQWFGFVLYRSFRQVFEQVLELRHFISQDVHPYRWIPDLHTDHGSHDHDVISSLNVKKLATPFGDQQT